MRALVPGLVVLTLLQPAAQPPLPALALDSYPAAARTAIARAYQAAQAAPGEAQAAGHLGRVLHAWEQWEAARAAYARASALAPKAHEWRYLEGLVLVRLARPDLAVDALRAALAREPTYLPARLKLAEALLDAGDLAESRTRFTELTDPSCAPAVQFGLGTIAAREGRHADAVSHLERAVALFPEFAAAHYALARSYRALGRVADAEAALARHARFGARWPAIPDPLAESVAALRADPGALLQRGVKQAEAGEVEAAIASHEAALALNPSFAQAHANLISLYGRARNWSKAEEHYRAVVALAVNVADAHYDYGVLLGMQERWDAAADAYRKTLELNPQHAQARNNLGQMLERLGRPADAAAEYRLAVESQPTLRIARFNLGRMLIAQGANDAAAAELSKITEPRDAEAPRYLFALATAHLRAGRRDEAIRWAMDAKGLAERFGDTALAAAIEKDLARIR
ncbi:MAG TPA: tetratricopeptide repeat protein [Vicinamibacterales bacterium]|nr:tetratricopeptide repeat protein [Vicinamibacterales bacterium]